MMDISTCTTIVLVLIWLYLCLQAVGVIVILVGTYHSTILSSTTTVLPITTALSTILLAVCLRQCKKAGYLVSPMTRYHWVLLILVVILQILALIMKYLSQLDLQGRKSYVPNWTYPIYVVTAVLLVVLGGTLFCGWKCSLFCRPCCKSQYICYGSTVVIVLLILTLVAVTASMKKYHRGDDGRYAYSHVGDGEIEISVIGYLEKMTLPITQCYSTAIIWNTTVKLPYTVPEVLALIASAVAVSSLLSLAILGGNRGVLISSTTYPFLAVHLVSLGITWYCLEYKEVFHWSKDYMCFGLLATVVILVALVVLAIYIATSDGESEDVETVQYTLMGYSAVLMVPTLWYAYRCDLLTWKWNSCLHNKKGLKATDTAEKTAAGTDITTE